MAGPTDGGRTNLGNFPDEFDDDLPLSAADDAPDSADLNVREDEPAEPEAPPPPPERPAPPPPPPPAPDELQALRREIEFLRAGQVAPVAAPSAPPPAPDVLGMIDGTLGAWKPSAAEVAEAMADPEKMAALIYNVARVSTGAGAALGMQASQNVVNQTRQQERVYQDRGEAFRAQYGHLGKYDTLVRNHAAQVHAELQGRQVAPQAFAGEVARRVTHELETYGINPKAETRKRVRPATAERGSTVGTSAAPRGKTGKRQSQIQNFLGLH